jgi:hypothetical protein
MIFIQTTLGVKFWKFENGVCQTRCFVEFAVVHVESQSFLDIVGLLNPAVVKMMVKANAIANHVIKT